MVASEFSSSSATRRSNLGINPVMGFHFQPTDQQLLKDFLRAKVQGNPLPLNVAHEIDLYSHDPDQLPRHTECWLDGMAYYFATTTKRYSNGSRKTRSTPGGYWRGTGNDSDIHDGAKIIGFKKILVFYRGRSSSGIKTNWVMHEYRLNQKLDMPPNPNQPQMDNFVLCKVFRKISQIDTEVGHGKRKREEFEVLQENMGTPEDAQSKSLNMSSREESEVRQENHGNFDGVQRNLLRGSSREDVEVLQENNENLQDAPSKSLQGCFREGFEVIQGNKEDFEGGQTQSLQGSSREDFEVLHGNKKNFEDAQYRFVQGSLGEEFQVFQENEENFEAIQSKSLQQSSKVELEVFQDNNVDFEGVQSKSFQVTFEENESKSIEDMYFEVCGFAMGPPPYFL